MTKMVGKGQWWSGGEKKIKTNVERMLRKLEWMKKGSSCELQGQVAKGGEQKGVHNTFLHALFFVCFVSVVALHLFAYDFIISNIQCLFFSHHLSYIILHFTCSFGKSTKGV
jgi:hypothetical protein